ncbi:MAG: 2-isopropylmalate synthase [Gammaproteobacteria bacterium]|nr:2-isopropylmalate synthase [Gammaproteobacteria bacterium]MDH3768283.1 2-isopropylmalate synthase [Gammaproteobacteria bacterium]
MQATATDKLLIFDTTLRDGEQAPGCSMTFKEKLRVAALLAELRVDVIEAGFPAASPGDLDAVRAVATEIDGPVICGLARCNASDIEHAWEALRPAARQRLHLFLATSPIHRKYKLTMNKEQVLNRLVESINLARKYFDDVEFSPEDASRTEPEFLAEVIEAAIEAGANTVNIPDTVGFAVPNEFAKLLRYLNEHVPNIDQAVLSVHCHDDLGLAVANSLAAIQAGARQVECTVNGIGERAGNCSLEEIVMALKTRQDAFDCDTGIDTTRLYPASRLVASVTGLHVQRNKAIVGENAFSHEAGIHQHGMLKHHSTYEIMRPEHVGIPKTSLVLGKHSGRHAVRDRISELGFEIDDEELNRVFSEFKQLADRKKDILDADIEALVLNNESGHAGPWQLIELNTSSGTGRSASAVVRLAHTDGKVYEETAVGHGPVEAACRAIESMTGVAPTLRKYDVRNVTVGEDAQGDVTLIVEYNGREYHGHGLNTDVIQASASAFLQTVNRISLRLQSKKTPQPIAAQA